MTPNTSPHHHSHLAFTETDLVSDGSVPAVTVDPNLVNPWGISFNDDEGPFWVSDNGTGVTTIYDGAGNIQTVAGHTAITIATPPGHSDPAKPTGQVYNEGEHGFQISHGGHTASSVFLFATEDGTISGWNPTVDSGSSVLAVDRSDKGSIYKGLAIGEKQNGDQLLFAADFHRGKVDVFNENFHHVRSFTDPNIPDGYAPFNVQELKGHLYVTYAKQDADGEDDVRGHGNGFVDEFDLKGHLIDRVASHGPLNSPWGLAIAPEGFGKFSGQLLVGNFGNGKIDVFDRHTDEFLGHLKDKSGDPIKIEGLWAIVDGNTGPNADPNKLYFTAGPDDEQHGLFGSIEHTDHHAGLMLDT